MSWRIQTSFAAYPLCLAIAMIGGCAAHAPSGPGMTTVVDGRTGPETRPAVAPQALLTLDQIPPRVRLNPPASQPATQPSLQALHLYAQAHIAELEGDRPAAIDFLRKAVAADPNSFSLHYELGKTYQANSSYSQQSIAELERAVAIEPDHLDLQTNLGRQYLAKNDTTTALIYLRLATQTEDYRNEDPRGVVTDFFLASALARQGYDQAALDVYQQLARKLRSQSMAMRMDEEASLLAGHADALTVEIAGLLQKLGRFDQAVASYQQAIAADPDNLNLRANYCRCLLAANQPGAAVKVAVDCVVKFGATQRSLELLREVCRGHENAAIDELTQLNRQRPADRPILFALADLLATVGRRGQADTLLADAFAKHPKEAEILIHRIEIRREARDLDGAARLLIESSNAHPQLTSQLEQQWGRLMRPSSVGRIKLATFQSIQVDPAARSAKFYWQSRGARIWRRESAARDALEEAVAQNPPFAPAYREMTGTIWSDTEVGAAEKIRACDQLAARAAAAGNAAIAAEVNGLCLFNQDQPAKAAEQFAIAIKAGGASPDLLFERAAALHKAGDNRGFESLMWGLLSDWPSFRDPYFELYAYYAQAGNASQAQRVLATWLTNDPADPMLQEIQAREDFRDGHPEAADAIFRRLIDERPDDSDLIESVGRFYAQNNREAIFAHLLEERLTNDPKNLAISLALAETYASQNQSPQASHVLDAAHKLAADDADVLYILSGLYSRIGQTQTSEQILSDVLKLDPTHAGACNDLGYSWADQGKNLRQAESLIRQAIKSEPHNASFLDSMGWVLYKLGRFDEARGFLDRAIGNKAAGAPEPDPVVLDHHGDLLYRLGDRQGAEADWHRATDQITAANAPRDDLRDLRLQLMEKQKQLKAGQPVSVAPVSAEGGGKQ
ncbi:MAG TPA: tetratricopeptide repeat protein [Humisphaera sp.]|jgi:tetratricopeptide (TPR) repeat protein|nr:tetratricopeptide repeat protein [Humisphaera sp.]